MATTPQYDPELSQLLQTWKVQPDADPDLAGKVWRRIDSRPHKTGLQSWLDLWSKLLTRPLVAATGLAACAALGFTVAEMRHEAERHDVLARVAAEYVQTIDPVIMTRAPGDSHQP